MLLFRNLVSMELTKGRVKKKRDFSLSSEVPPNVGVPTSNFRGTDWGRRSHQGVKKISLHFWMIQIMFKNKFKKKKTEPKSEGVALFFF